MKKNPVLKLILFALLAYVVWTMCSGKKMFYTAHGHPIEIQPKTTQSLFDLPYKMECVPGAGSNEESYYTRELSPGGLCGAQQLVSDHGAYSITGGIGMD